MIFIIYYNLKYMKIKVTETHIRNIEETIHTAIYVDVVELVYTNYIFAGHVGAENPRKEWRCITHIQLSAGCVA